MKNLTVGDVAFEVAFWASIAALAAALAVVLAVVFAPACTSDDGSGASVCVWRAEQQGNYAGHAFVSVNL
ncbi:MAG: hypothetical protein FWF90_05055 [Promicromonosporaceae bacterium]|nr:hypothetical protein [Promicromonosporaceae bacterium]